MEEKYTSDVAADSIFAVASGSAVGAVTIIRVSGPSSATSIEALSRRAVSSSHNLELRRLCDPVSGELLDIGLVVFFRGPDSFTGEDIAEFQVHGGRAVAAAILSAVGSLPGLRPAEPGEFTRRAYEHGKLDITAAEAIGDLVAADTEAQRRQALRQMEGELSDIYGGWRAQLLESMSKIEADIDFSDEEIPGDLIDVAADEVAGLVGDISQHLDDARRGELVRDGVDIAILGAPNAGKSSLLNRLARREAAIVSQIAGTTRDVIEVHLNLGGYAVTVADTAGLRESGGDTGLLDGAEHEGITRALARAETADIRIVVFDVSILPDLDEQSANMIDRNSVAVFNKRDLEPELDLPELNVPVFAVSAVSGEGVDALMRHLTEVVCSVMPMGDTAPLTKIRHRLALEGCVAALMRSQTASLPELRAEDMRLALQSIGQVTGRIDIEEVLGAIFGGFCIGK